MKKTVLLIDDQERFLNAFKTGIEGLGYAVSLSIDGTGALHMVTLQKYDAIICDIQMPGMSGLEFLRKAKELTKAPVILMTGFAELADAQQAFNEGAKGFIAKPFRIEDIKTILESITGTPKKEQEIKKKNLDENFFPLMIDEFLSGKQIQYDIYIRVNAYKYLKLAHGGENLEQDRIAKFKQRGVRVLYLTKEDYKRYVSFLLNLNTRISECKSIDFEKKVKVLRLAGEATLKGMFQGVMQEPELSEAKMVVNGINRLVCEDETLSDLLLALKNSGDVLHTHAMAVSVLAVMIAQKLNWTSQGGVLSVGLAGFFHDIGKKEFPKAMLEKARLQYTPDEVSLYETHPVRGANLLSSIPKFPSEVVQAVLQHHEACSGVGFPKHLTKTKIIPIARIIAIADDFTTGLFEGPNAASFTPREIVGRMRSLKADCFDSEYLAALEGIIISNA